MQEFLASAGIEARNETNAKKDTFREEQALELASQVQEIYSVRGKKVTYLNLKKDAPEVDEIRKMLLGPTGNLRAPSLRVGKTLVVGFNSDTLNQVFGI